MQIAYTVTLSTSEIELIIQGLEKAEIGYSLVKEFKDIIDSKEYEEHYEDEEDYYADYDFPCGY